MILEICVNMDSSSKSAFFINEEQLQLLNENCPRNLNKNHLRFWLSYRTETAKDGSTSTAGTKRELIFRYSYSVDSN